MRAFYRNATDRDWPPENRLAILHEDSGRPDCMLVGYHINYRLETGFSETSREYLHFAYMRGGDADHCGYSEIDIDGDAAVRAIDSWREPKGRKGKPPEAFMEAVEEVFGSIE